MSDDNTSAPMDLFENNNDDDDISITEPQIHEQKRKIGDEFIVLEDKTIDNQNECIERKRPFWIRNATNLYDQNFSSKNVELKYCDMLSDNMKSTLKNQSFTHLLPMQYAVINYALNQYKSKRTSIFTRPKDICISAPTGSGKTLAFSVPIVEILKQRRIPALRALMVLPTRNLAKQVFTVVKNLCESTDLHITSLIGEHPIDVEQRNLLFEKDDKLYLSDIVICTPGRLVDHIFNTPHLDFNFLRFLVIDEADKVIVDESQDWFTVLENAIYFSTSSTRKYPTETMGYLLDMNNDIHLQKILASATLMFDPGPLKRFSLINPKLFSTFDESKAKQCKTRPTEFDQRLISTPSTLEERLIVLSSVEKPVYLVDLIKFNNCNSRVLIFTNKKSTTKLLTSLLDKLPEITVKSIHGSLPNYKRDKLISDFKVDKTNILVCTDAMARGIDIPSVNCVLSYDLPSDIITYVHRAGRTARAGQKGIVYQFVEKKQVHYFKSKLHELGRHNIPKEAHFSKRRKSRAHVLYDKAKELYDEEQKKSLRKMSNVKFSSID